MSLHAHDTSEQDRYLRLVPLSLATALVELSAGAYAGSLALATDAVHTLLDVFENLLNAFVARRARLIRDPVRIRKIGFAASLVLIGASTAFMAYEAVRRITGQEVDGLTGWTVAVAIFSLIMNLWQLRIHFSAPDEHRNLTHWGQTLHIVTDVAGSLAAIIGTAAAAFLGVPLADAWAAIGIVVLVWWRMIYAARMAFGSTKNENKPWHHVCEHDHH